MADLVRLMMVILAGVMLAIAAAGAHAAELPAIARDFIENHCLDCHDSATRKGDLDLQTLRWDPADAGVFEQWVTIHDRVRDGEMPPKKKARPEAGERDAFVAAVARPLGDADRARAEGEGRSTWRRLNRYEYENSLRDLLDAPWLQIKPMLPEDGEAHRFNKVGDALDVSHVQMGRYLSAADYALREVLAYQIEPPQAPVTRYYTREEPSFYRRAKFSEFNRSSERATFPIIGNEADIPALKEEAPMTVGDSDPQRRELESMGVVASSYEPIELRFSNFQAPVSGHYKLRFNTHSFWAGPESEKRWWKPDRMSVSAGRTHEPVAIYSETPPRQVRKLGSFDITPQADIDELEVYLLKGETIRPDAVRLFRSRPPNWHNPLATPEGQPGVTFRWMEVEGPIHQQWPGAGHQLMFGDLPLRTTESGVEVVSESPLADARRLLRGFMERAYRRPVQDADVQRFVQVFEDAQSAGLSFTDAMITCYSAVLCSPGFVTLQEKPGRLDDHALAARLSYFLWNSEPDAELRSLAAAGKLHDSDILRAQTQRLLDDPRSARFVEAFLDYWLDLRKADATSPDGLLYNDYYLDDFLVESAVDETRAFFHELIRGDLPASNIVDSDFVMINQRLARHYGIEGVEGVAIRRVAVPEGSPRGGLLTQASVLKVTANGTTTSPVVRGAWVMERIIGKAPPPPPPSVPAVEPDTRGAVTIREQLEKHRSEESCNACHAKIDPPGFALESFDVVGGWRDRYRALGDGEKPEGYGHNGQPFDFYHAQEIDASGELPGGGGSFKDIHEFKAAVLKDKRQVARNLANQLTVYATGAPVSFGDRQTIEKILDGAAGSDYGVRSLIHELIQSRLFLQK